jgi:hypothetical protein
VFIACASEVTASYYCFEECLEDYRFATLYCLVYAVIIICTVDPTKARGLANFHANFERVAAAITDLNAAAAMPRFGATRRAR